MFNTEAATPVCGMTISGHSTKGKEGRREEEKNIKKWRNEFFRKKPPSSSALPVKGDDFVLFSTLLVYPTFSSPSKMLIADSRRTTPRALWRNGDNLYNLLENPVAVFPVMG